MFGFFKRARLKAGMNKCFVDAAMDVKLAETLVYSQGIEPFYNGINKFTKGLTNQQSAVIGSIVMAMSYFNEGMQQYQQLGKESFPSEKGNNMYEVQTAQKYLEQVLLLLICDAGTKWRKIASAYILSIGYFVEESVLGASELAEAIEDFNPSNIELDYELIQSVQDKMKHNY